MVSGGSLSTVTFTWRLIYIDLKITWSVAALLVYYCLWHQPDAQKGGPFTGGRNTSLNIAQSTIRFQVHLSMSPHCGRWDGLEWPWNGIPLCSRPYIKYTRTVPKGHLIHWLRCKESSLGSWRNWTFLWELKFRLGQLATEEGVLKSKLYCVRIWALTTISMTY
jgi:hypothetical protein